MLPCQKFEECAVDRVAIFKTFCKATMVPCGIHLKREMIDMVVLDMQTAYSVLRIEKCLLPVERKKHKKKRI